MKAKMLAYALVTLILSSSDFAEAQQAGKIPRIGYQSASSSGENNEEAFRQGLRELGYVEGQNIVIEWRFAQGKLAQVRRNAAELVQLKVDVIVTGGVADTRAAKAATSTIPIVMTNDSDPVGEGLVAALPGLAAMSRDWRGSLLWRRLSRLTERVITTELG